METNLDIIHLSKEYITAKNALDLLEREYDQKKAKVYLSTSIQAFGNAPSRDAAAILQMETEFPDLIDRLYTARGIAREYFYLREAVLSTKKQERSDT